MAAAVVLVPLTVGCGRNEWQVATYPASGTITINGDAPEGAVVELHSVGEQPDVRNSRPWGIVQADGTYTLSTYEAGDGAPPGEYAVTLRWPPDITKPSFADRLGGRFLKAEGSQWRVTIAKDENELPLIELANIRVQAEQDAEAPRRAPPGPGMGS